MQVDEKKKKKNVGKRIRVVHGHVQRESFQVHI